MRGVYTVNFTFATFTNGLICEIGVQTGNDLVIELQELHVEVADPTAGEDLDIEINEATTLATSGGASVTPQKTENGDQAAVFTCKSHSTALVGTASGSNPLYRRGFPSEVGWHFTPTPEQYKYARRLDGWHIFCNSTITSGTLIVNATVREIG